MQWLGANARTQTQGWVLGFFWEHSSCSSNLPTEMTDSFSEVLKARLFFFSKILAQLLDIMLLMLKSVGEVLWRWYPEKRWVPSTFTNKWKCEPLMALSTETFVSVANLPSTSGSLSSNTGSTHCFSSSKPSLQAEEPGSAGKPLLTNLSKLAQTENPGMQKELGDPYGSPIPH